jgi:hypothetical protein
MATESVKKNKIEKFSKSIVIFAGLAIFIIIFGLASTNILLTRYAYQQKVINLQKIALANLNEDSKSLNSLTISYEKFISPKTNIIGGPSNKPNVPNGGNNAKIILDALPSSYDFTQFITTLQNLLLKEGVVVQSITSTDQSSSSNYNNGSGVNEIPFQFSVSGPYPVIENLISVLQRSTTPIDILSLNITGTQQDLTLNVNGQTYYQPEFKFKIKNLTVH